MAEATTQALRDRMEALDIDVDDSLSVLDRFNRGEFDSIRPAVASGIPEADGDRVVDSRDGLSLTISRSAFDAACARLSLDGPALRAVARLGNDDTLQLDHEALDHLGLIILPIVSYGVLNGGSATSYGDEKKNRGLDSRLFDLLAEPFDRLAPEVRGKPKGITPGFINPDGTPGPSFMELKMRSLLLLEAKRRRLLASLQAMRSDVDRALGSAADLDSLLPFAEMTSVHTHEAIVDAYAGYAQSPLLRSLIDELGIDPTKPVRGVQRLRAAYTHSDRGRPKGIFADAWGKPGEPLAIPGGHGQVFSVMRPVYEELYRAGKRLVYIGNVDNIGFTPDPAAIAYAMLRQAPGVFDFSFRTAIDVKGGMLMVDQSGAMTCADIGVAVSREDVAKAEATGKRVLFNCAIGLFRIEDLIDPDNDAARRLPMRFSDQDKDAGRYSQAEQVTWEIIGTLPDAIVFGTEKTKRYLAAKLLVESLMTSGLAMDNPSYPTDPNPAKDLLGTARLLHAGLVERMTNAYDMVRSAGVWVARELAT